MKELIKNRISELRRTMQEKGLDAYLIYGTDPHLSEYIPAYWQTRPYISGFTGSAGMVIVSTDTTALWTDSRYFLQAANELSGTGIELVKMRVAGHPTPAQWLSAHLQRGSIVGTDEACISVSQFRQLQNYLSPAGINLLESGDLLNEIWTDRPPLPSLPVYEHEAKYASTDRKTKREAICTELDRAGADLQIITALDDLAWTFNLRGNDVECNPVFMGYGYVSREQTILFIENGKLPSDLRNKLEAESIQVKGYGELMDFLHQLPAKQKIGIDPERTNHLILTNIPGSCIVVEGLSVPCKLKAIKTEDEIRNIQQAMRKDGVAMLKFLFWLEKNLGQVPITEFTVAEKLIEFRAQQPEFKAISFFPIVGYKGHGAIVHFHVSSENALPIEPDGFLLFDSGGQYLDGTTDITRTIALGEMTTQQKTDYTLVLKGMIALTIARFPVNTKGYHLDILARNALWQIGLNYGHGTGHGVGYFLNVHEGPMSIRQEFNDHSIEPGMVLSNEPGLYRLGEYGIRTENMIVCRKDESTEFGDFLRFDTLTLCPIDTRPIDKNLIHLEEITWLNAYHQRVCDELAPLVNDELKGFLTEITKPI